MSTKTAKLAWILYIVAALLALSAAAIRYFADGEVRWTLIAAGAFLLAMGYSNWTRTPRG